MILDIVWIIATVWIYAAIRPRFGPGPRTAGYAGIVVVGRSAPRSPASSASLGIFGLHLFLASRSLALVNSIVSTMVGAWFYTEETA